MVGSCIVVGGEAFSVDASLIRADVNPAKRVPGDEPIDGPDRQGASRAVAEYLRVLDQEGSVESTTLRPPGWRGARRVRSLPMTPIA